MLAQGIHGHEVLPSVDLVLDTIAMVACVVLTALAWARFRERHVIASSYHAAAFLALAVAYAIAVLTSLQRTADLGGLAQPEDTQVLVFAVARLAAAILFVIAGVFTSRRTYGWNPVWILVAPTLGVPGRGTSWDASSGPPPAALLIVVFDDPTGLPHIAPFGAVIHLVTSALFFVGAYVSRGLWHAGRAVSDGWIAVGLVFAGFAELHWTLYPSAHPGQVVDGRPAAPRLLRVPAGRPGELPSARASASCEPRTSSSRSCATPRWSARRPRSARGWRASCTTGWHRTCGWPSCGPAS